MMTATEMKLREREQRQARVERFQRRIFEFQRRIERQAADYIVASDMLREFGYLLHENADLAREPLLEYMQQLTTGAISINTLPLPNIAEFVKQEPDNGK